MSGLAWTDPWVLVAALLVLLALWWSRRRGAGAVLFAPARFLGDEPRRLPRSWRVRLAGLPRALAAGGLVLALLALARPVESVALPEEREGIDLLLCLDTSSSMTARDLDPDRTRLDVALETAARFVAARPDDRIGLLTFARYPDLRCPPTRDHDALLAFLERVRPVAGDGPEDATGVGTAVARAAQVLGGGGVVVLLTDGEENVATADKPDEIAPVHAAQLCARVGGRVHAVTAGLGRRGPGGAWVEVDTEPVRRLARATGGLHFVARDAGALAAIWRDIDAREKIRFAEPRFETVERFGPLLAAAVALLLAARLLGGSVLGALP